MNIINDIIESNAENGIKTRLLLPVDTIENREKIREVYSINNFGLNPFIEFETDDEIRYQIYMEAKQNDQHPTAIMIRVEGNFVTGQYVIGKMGKKKYSKLLTSLADVLQYIYLLELNEPMKLYYPLYEINSLMIKADYYKPRDSLDEKVLKVNSAILNNTEINGDDAFPILAFELGNYFLGPNLNYYEKFSRMSYIISINDNVNRKSNSKRDGKYSVNIFGQDAGKFYITHAELINKMMESTIGTTTNNIREAVNIAYSMILEARKFIKFQIDNWYKIFKLPKPDMEETKQFSDKIIWYLSQYPGFSEIFKKAERQFNMEKILRGNAQDAMNGKIRYSDLINFFQLCENIQRYQHIPEQKPDNIYDDYTPITNIDDIMI